MTRLHNNPHDALFRVLFEDSGRADPLIREHLPPEVADLLAPDSMRLLPGSWIDSELVSHQADVLYEGRLRNGEPVAVYVLLEHKSWDDRNLPLQVLRYQSRIWESYRKGVIGDAEGASKGRLPSVIPLVFYHGRSRWTHPLSVAGMMDEGTPEAVRRYAPASECVLRDLGEYESEELSRDVVSWAVLATLVMALSGEVSEERLHRVLAAVPEGHPLLNPLLRYIVITTDIRLDALDRIGRETRPRDWEKAMGTIAEEWRSMYLAEGRAEGRAETLLRLLAGRFGSVPASMRSRVFAASGRDIDIWTDALLDADSMDRVFAASSGDPSGQNGDTPDSR